MQTTIRDFEDGAQATVNELDTAIAIARRGSDDFLVFVMRGSAHSAFETFERRVLESFELERDLRDRAARALRARRLKSLLALVPLAIAGWAILILSAQGHAPHWVRAMSLVFGMASTIAIGAALASTGDEHDDLLRRARETKRDRYDDPEGHVLRLEVGNWDVAGASITPEVRDQADALVGAGLEEEALWLLEDSMARTRRSLVRKVLARRRRSRTRGGTASWTTTAPSA